MAILVIILSVLLCAFVIASILLYLNYKKVKDTHGDTNRKMYELAILKELGERIGYSLDVGQIVDIITGSLHQFIDYSVVSYMLLQPEQIVFKAHLERSVSERFIKDVRTRMLNSLAALLEKDFSQTHVDEVITGAIIEDDASLTVQSFFNIPLVIGDKVVGVLTVADVKPGLYRDEEMTILYKITQQASQAVTRLENVVQTEQRKLNSMVESITEGVIMTDQDYRLVVINPTAKNILHLNDKDSITIFDVMTSLNNAFDLKEKLEESIKLDKIGTIDEIVIDDKFFQVTIAPVKSALAAGELGVLGGVAIFHDITQDKKLEQLREDYTAMMVHELRSPLNNILRMIEAINDVKLQVTPEQRNEFMDLIYENSGDMLSLVNDLLDAAKIEAGQFTVEKKPQDLKPIINDRVDFFKTQADKDNITLSVNYDSATPGSLNFDERKVTQVLNNYLSNAIKYTSPGGKITLDVITVAKDQIFSGVVEQTKPAWLIDKSDSQLSGLTNAIVVGVTDTGEGIPAEVIPQLFQKFSQAKGSGEKKGIKGTGLGLVIVKGIIKAHGGVVGVASKEGEGSTFYFTLPLD
ncbi:GAF domain-containing protein [candidate division WWE3 bacterium]|uniref:histidine kinase n=1 Tax=candidate division WWE3 bacterium TaxID=2053526 RepID=A0A955LK67_UNCKA|nr:GAF domain-containing protein [candidate division WWE3 bacterium]